MPKLPVISGKDMVRFLEKEGFTVLRSKGSHFMVKHSTSGATTTVPVHGKESLRPGTLLAYIV